MTDLHFHRRAEDEVPVDAVPPGMTAEQLQFFTEQTERAVHKGVREGVRQYRNRAVQGFVILVVGLVCLTWFQSHETSQRRALAAEQRNAIVASGRAVALTGCNRDFKTAQAFQALIEAVRAAAEKRPPSIERANALHFWDEVLRISPLPDCRKAQNIVTQDPNRPIISIDPFYPGAPYAPKPPSIKEG
jgi:hypothetical protein